MGKRITVREGLKKRLYEHKRSLAFNSFEIVFLMGYEDNDMKKELQHEINLKNDIDQIEYLLWCLDNRGSLDCRRKMLLEKLI